MSTAFQVVARVLVLLSFGLASQLPVRITTEAWPPHIPKGAAQALSSYLVLTGLLGSALATTTPAVQASINMTVAALLGLAAAGLWAGICTTSITTAQPPRTRNCGDWHHAVREWNYRPTAAR